MNLSQKAGERIVDVAFVVGVVTVLGLFLYAMFG